MWLWGFGEKRWPGRHRNYSKSFRALSKQDENTASLDFQKIEPALLAVEAQHEEIVFLLA